MNAKPVVAALGAVAHDSRLGIYRVLVEKGPDGPDGLAAGAIAEKLDMPPSSLTFHLQHMLRAGVVTQRRVGRQIIYAADFAAMNALVAYLTENCCGAAACCAPVCNPAAVASPTRKQRRSA